MKTIATIVLSVLFMTTYAPKVQAQQTESEKVVTIDASMSCQGCKKTIETGLAQEAGVKSVVANLRTKKVTVTYNANETNEGALVEGIEKLGYSASVSKEQPEKEKEKKQKDGKKKQ